MKDLISEETHSPDDRRFVAPWEKALVRVMTPIEEFVHSQTSGGLVLMISAIIALVLANSPLAEAYAHLFHTEISIGIGEYVLTHTAHHWINDALMAVFFFLVGLEIKYEILVGELSNLRRAMMPILAAIGGMVFPALIYFGLNPEGDASRGWGIPMATDIAFAVGVLALLGSRVPRSAVMFLLALAIVDDLGAVVVIAMFYTETINSNALLAAAGIMLVLTIFNLLGVRKPAPYLLIGVLLWLAMLNSGIHATIAGVLLAITIPTRSKYDGERFSKHIRHLMDRYDQIIAKDPNILTNGHALAVVQTLDRALVRIETPLQRVQHKLELPVAMFIIPLFALANAGVAVDTSNIGALLTNNITLGVILGLVVGKGLGVAGTVWIAKQMNIGQLPDGVNMNHMWGIGLLAGIGFTMSIFVAELAFPNSPELKDVAKLGILIASAIAGTLGMFWMAMATKGTK